MKHDIDLFGKDFPMDYRWDSDRNAKLLNIVFAGGTFGNFLKFFLDKFSTKTPNITGEPFTELGTSHKIGKEKYSGLIQRYHSSFINDNQGQTGLPVCLIVPSTEKHYLYLKQAQWYRADDRKWSTDNLWKKAVGEMPVEVRAKALEIIKLYDIKDHAHFSWLPKFVVRDWYKLDFLKDVEDTQNGEWFEAFKDEQFFTHQETYPLDLETFFDWQTFMKNITELNDRFGLALDFDRQAEMKEMFDRGLALDDLRQKCNLAEVVVEKDDSDIEFKNLDVATEGFIYAGIEKKNPFIQMPLTNRFFRDTDEIRQFISYFPNWYRRSNPNIG